MMDIAITFYWPPSEMERMSLAELMAWCERARVRSEADHD
jgi:hypothetical protein